MNTFNLVLLHCIKKNFNVQQKFLKCVCVCKRKWLSLEISPKRLGATHWFLVTFHISSCTFVLSC